MNKNLRLLLWVSLISALGVVLFAVDNNLASAAAGYGYSCSNTYWYGNSCATSNNGYGGWSVWGTYVSSTPWSVFSGWTIVPISTIINTPNTTSPVVWANVPLIVNLSNGGWTSTTNLPSTTDLPQTNPVFVLPNTGIN